jgi:hypothetical protein
LHGGCGWRVGCYECQRASYKDREPLLSAILSPVCSGASILTISHLLEVKQDDLVRTLGSI